MIERPSDDATARIAGVIAGGALLRIVATLGISPTVYVDSVEYRGIALFGGNRRPWTVPLLYAVVGDAQLRVLAHAVIGAAAWACLALAVAEVVRHPAVKVGAAVAVMATALTTSVTNYDATITSETVAVSLAALLLVAWLWLATSASVLRASGLLAVATLFAFTRNDHPLVLAATIVPVAVVAVRLRHRAWAVAAVGLVVVSGWSWLAANRNDEIERFNLAMLMANRVVRSPDQLEWFTDRGMPLPEGVEPGVGLAGGDTTLAFADDPRWNRWAADDGRADYTRYLVTHPGYLLLEPWPDLLGVRSTSLEPASPSPVLLSPGDAYGRVHPVLPSAVESLVWGRGEAGALAVALAALGVTAAARTVASGDWRRPSRLLARFGAARVVATVALVVSAGHFVLVWHASPIELGRLAMVPAATLHVAVLVLLAVTIDRRLPAPERPAYESSSRVR